MNDSYADAVEYAASRLRNLVSYGQIKTSGIEPSEVMHTFVFDIRNGVDGKGADLPPGRPSFITRVLGFDSRQFRVWQARRMLRHQIAQALGALLPGFRSPAMNVA